MADGEDEPEQLKRQGSLGHGSNDCSTSSGCDEDETLFYSDGACSYRNSDSAQDAEDMLKDGADSDSWYSISDSWYSISDCGSSPDVTQEDEDMPGQQGGNAGENENVCACVPFIFCHLSP